jgi:tetratricopeptide (TPR) repeat protein
LAAGLARSLNGQSCKGAENQLSTAWSALDRGDTAGAEQGFSSLQSSRPDCAEALLGLGRARAAQQDYRTASELFARYTQAAPRDARGYVAMAELLLAGGRAAEADALSAKAVSVDSRNVGALVMRGRILAMKGESSLAEQSLLKACELAPDDPQAHFELGGLYDRLLRNGKAVEQFEQVIRLSPQNPRVYDYLALNLEPLGRFEQAERAYRNGLAVNRGPLFDSFLDYNYGRFLIKLNRLDEAVRYLDHAVELKPDTRAVHFERAKLAEKLGKYEQARSEAERALALPDPAGVILDLQVYYQLVGIYTQLGQKELAARYARLAETAKIPVHSRVRDGR